MSQLTGWSIAVVVAGCVAAPFWWLTSAAPALTPDTPELPVVDADAAAGDDAPPGLDAGDAPATQPHELHRVRPVEQLGLERGDGLAGRVHHAAQPADHLDAATRAHLLQRHAAGPLLHFLLQRMGVEPGGAGREALDQGKAFAHVLSLARCRARAG